MGQRREGETYKLDKKFHMIDEQFLVVHNNDICHGFFLLLAALSIELAHNFMTGWLCAQSSQILQFFALEKVLSDNFPGLVAACLC